jgi:hypothetical protein
MNCADCDKPVDRERERFVEWMKGEDVVRIKHEECADEAERVEFTKTGRLTSNLTLKARLRADRAGLHVWGVDDDINAAMDRLHVDIKRFEVDAWFGGVSSEVEASKHHGKQLVYPRTKKSMQSAIEDSKDRTIEAKLSDFTVTGQEMAGRAMVELESAVGRVTLITAAREQTPRMGVLGVDGTEDECRRMINATREGWRDLAWKKSRS